MIFYVLRHTYNSTTTIGDLICKHRIVCYTLEDTVRTKKIPGKTAIPSGKYEVIVDYSPKFKRLMPLITGVPGFTGVRIHGGNSAKDTEGCLCVAYNKIDDRTIQGTAEREITRMLMAEALGKHYVEIIDTKKPS